MYKISIITLLISTLLISGCNSFKKNKPSSVNKEEMASKVIDEFKHAWNGYKKYAWGHDALNPLSGGFHDWYKESLLMTPVDAFSTMCTMGLEEEKKEAKEIIFSKLSFDKDMYVQHFEISIRLLGGLLSAYQMDGDERFLKLAEDLATRMLPVWSSPTGLPYRYVNLKTGAVRDSISNPAELGTYVLEYATLSSITKKPIFKEKAEKALLYLSEKRSSIDLIGSSININTGEWVDKMSHIRGGIDSYLEYLIKYYLFTGDKKYKVLWDKHKQALDKYAAQTVESGLWYSVVDMNTGERKATVYGALDAFYPGTLCLGGDLEQAKKLQESNFKLWTLHGVEPEAIDYTTMQIPEGNSFYILRPENIESAFYLYRFTKDEKYLKMGVEYYESLKKYCRTDIAYAHIKDVATKEKEDVMESFFLAETLSYLYLIFAPEEKFSFETHVFNTEAHPLKKLN
ncbi:MAG: glycoside hydrolase family 47 protein [Bacteroidales bacterium]|nr:MAG: glycoside hydrolase family 47 protein [Bacteroidales bacterium]